LTIPFNSRDALPAALQALGLELSLAVQQRLLAHLDLIAKWNRVYNLTAVRDPAEMFTHHLLDSLAVVRPLAQHVVGVAGPSASPRSPNQPIRIMDVGAGAGLPGVTLAIALPEVMGAQWRAVEAAAGAPVPGLEVTCVDAVAKKAGFIRQVAAELNLAQLHAQHGRVEMLALSPQEVITCRAFASLADIVRLTERHLAPGGVWMALKGVTPEAEIAELPDSVEVFHVEPLVVPRLNAQRCLVWMRRRR